MNVQKVVRLDRKWAQSFLHRVHKDLESLRVFVCVCVLKSGDRDGGAKLAESFCVNVSNKMHETHSQRFHSSSFRHFALMFVTFFSDVMKRC